MLSDTRIRSAKPRQKPYKLADSRGLYLFVSTKGARSWRFDYRLGGKRNTLTLGLYPDIGLADARERHGEALRLVARGESPNNAKRLARHTAALKAGSTVKAVAEQWYGDLEAHRSPMWRDAAKRAIARINKAFGPVSLSDVTPQDVLALIKPLAKEKPKTAEYVRQTLSRIFRYGIQHNMPGVTDSAHACRGTIVVPEAKHHRPLSEKEIPDFLEKLDAYPGRLPTKLAAKLLLLTFVRKNELLNSMWPELDLDGAEWRIPAERMKMREPHTVPLSKQAVAAFRELKPLACGSKFVFPNIGTLDKPMSDTTLNVAFERMGYGGKFTVHGLRATASTILNEQGHKTDVIERQLAHAERNRVRAAYNRAEYLPERRALMQSWADHIDGLCAGKVVSIKKKHHGS